jgi:hypothetical protein
MAMLVLSLFFALVNRRRTPVKLVKTREKGRAFYLVRGEEATKGRMAGQPTSFELAGLPGSL